MFSIFAPVFKLFIYVPIRNYPKNALGWTLFYKWKYKHVLFLFLCVAGVLSLKLMDKTNHCLSTGLDGTLRKWCLRSGQQLFCIADAVSVQTHTPTHIHMIEERKIIITNPSSLVWKITNFRFFSIFLLKEQFMFKWKLWLFICPLTEPNQGSVV